MKASPVAARAPWSKPSNNASTSAGRSPRFMMTQEGQPLALAPFQVTRGIRKRHPRVAEAQSLILLAGRDDMRPLVGTIHGSLQMKDMSLLPLIPPVSMKGGL